MQGIFISIRNPVEREQFERVLARAVPKACLWSFSTPTDVLQALRNLGRPLGLIGLIVIDTAGVRGALEVMALRGLRTLFRGESMPVVGLVDGPAEACPEAGLFTEVVSRPLSEEVIRRLARAYVETSERAPQEAPSEGVELSGAAGLVLAAGGGHR